MRTRTQALVAWTVLSLTLGTAPTAFDAPLTSPGFLVIAPDRGYLGNEEIRAIWEDFRKGYRTRLVFISLAEDFEREVHVTLEGAVAEMQRKGAREASLYGIAVIVRHLCEGGNRRPGPAPPLPLDSQAVPVQWQSASEKIYLENDFQDHI